jgi:hypothetical protein
MKPPENAAFLRAGVLEIVPHERQSKRKLRKLYETEKRDLIPFRVSGTRKGFVSDNRNRKSAKIPVSDKATIALVVLGDYIRFKIWIFGSYCLSRSNHSSP